MSGHGSVDDLLEAAARSLREYSDTGWVRARDTVVTRLVRALRPGQAVRGTHADGSFVVSSHVLVARIEQALLDLPHARVVRIGVETDGDDHLTGIALALTVEYGHPIAPGAAAARERALAVARETTGVELAPGDVTADVMVADVYPSFGTLTPPAAG